MKYLGVTMLSSRSFKIFTEQSIRRAFHRTAVFGRIGRVAAEEVANVLDLVTKSRTFKSAFLRGQAARPRNKSEYNTTQRLQRNFFRRNSADAAKYGSAMKSTSRLFRKYFKTSGTEHSHTEILQFLDPWQQNT